MQRFYLPGGAAIAFSNGAMATLYQAWVLAAALRRPPRTEDEEAVVDWLRENCDRAADGYGYAFALDPPDAEIAAPARLAYLAELIRVTARDLACEAPPDEELWCQEVAWEPERQAHWHARLEWLAQSVESAAGEPA